VRAARIGRGPEGRYGEVALGVRLFDRVARADVNGALVLATGPASPDASEESLIEKALEQAAFEAVEQMRSRPTITAMVLWAKKDDVFLNVGTQGGLQPGMDMVAIRGGERIGKVTIGRADAIGSEGRIIEGPPLRAGDHLRAIYELPRDFGPLLEISPEKKKSYKALLTAAGLLLGLGLGSYGSKTRQMTEGDITVPSLKVSNLANGLETGLTSYNDFLGYAQPLTLITWEHFGGHEGRRVVAYEMIRNWGEIPRSMFPDDVYPVDPDIDRCFAIDTIVTQGWEKQTTIDLDPVTGEVIITEGVDEGDGVDEVTEGDDQLDYSMVQTGPNPGVTQNYALRPVLREQYNTGTGVFEWRLNRDTQWTVTQPLVSVSAPFARPYDYIFVGYAEGVYEIWSLEPNPEIIGNTATFYFYSPIGADEMVVQVTRDPNLNFDPGLTYEATRQGQPDPFVLKDTFAVDLSSVPGTGDIFWWRIGAHSRRNATLARPYPTDQANDYDWVWSERNSFGLSSSARQALRQQERDLLTRTSATAARSPGRSRGDRVLRAD
jgi:hypothetical protein